MKTFRIYSLSNFQIYTTVVILYIISRALTYNWKFIPFDFTNSLSPHPLISFSVSLFFFLFRKTLYLFILKILFIYFQRQDKGGRKRRKETFVCGRNIDQLLLTHPQPGTWPATQACALTGNRTSNLSVCRMALNPLSHTSQVLPGFLYFLDVFLNCWRVSDWLLTFLPNSL